MIRVHHQTDGAGIVVHEQNLFPGFAAIRGFEDAAVRIGREHVPHRCDINDVGIFRIHEERADRMRVAQSSVLPGFAFIGGFENAVAGDHVRADVASPVPA